MKLPLKVQLISNGQSEGRGIGVYEQNLIKALENKNQVTFVKSNPDLIHYAFFDLFKPTLKIDPQIPTIVTIHDLTPLVMANRYPKGLRGILNLFRQWLTLSKSSAIITDSECSKKDIQKYFWIPENKIFVTPLATNDLYKTKVTDRQKEQIKKKYNIPDHFILTVAASPNPNKNLPSLAEVTERIGIPLVIVGRGMNQKFTMPVHPELIDLVRLGVYQHLIRLDNVPNEELLVFYKLASVYAQASLYEGFGIPLLEAMTAECPVVSSRSSSLPEVYGSETITFNPKSLKSMEKAFKKFFKLTASQKEEYIKKNSERSKDFSWSKTADATISVYKNLYEKF